MLQKLLNSKPLHTENFDFFLVLSQMPKLISSVNSLKLCPLHIHTLPILNNTLQTYNWFLINIK